MSTDDASAPSDTHAGASRVPAHIAIIMDGNGRWAKARGLPRAAGHERGVEALRRTVEAAGEIGVRYLTVYSFSTENWRRPAAEVNALFGLLRTFIKKDLGRLKKEGVKINVIGRREGLPDDIAMLVEKAERETASNSDFVLNIAFNYGGREEIARAARALSADVASGAVLPSDVTEEVLASYLDTADMPDPDLLVRTSGEYRLSNFLLWQAAYSELVFFDVLWPDFDRAWLEKAVAIYSDRERRFGAVSTGDA
ncbi:isoprenyl transferase [uncultured Hyphomonas sp.]|jgi:undecaprenyl diphosphate synthase|uniref:isoprenyl transferase n=1 Tax=uncultured Hyphomonas sp. TaxID=225298 RepID=UPI000C58428E|nr:di-trans,poly-cis-decaprenylcistransferase [Hyphomonadaceae bacterium]MBA28124.1 di-trans,poly-cis-decaprenylcistransferase [Hyphomonadaceae bacterium]|tara:strand:+ start:40868 stop:41629 length:762 start_codon:yes stop_codon:yes gene_type:complete